MRDRRAIGAAGEGAAARWLKRRGYRLLERNVRLGRAGELDLVARWRGVLVLIEVKSKLAGETIGGFENITAAKRRKLWELGELYLQRHGGGEQTVRFDAVEVVFPDETLKRPTVRHIPDAFRGE